MLLIGGEWQDSQEHLEVLRPSDGTVQGKVAVASIEHTDAAVRAAKDAFSLPLSSHRRAELLRGVHRIVDAESEAFAQEICGESGKAIRECRQEVERALVTLELSAQEALRLEGAVLPCDVTAQEFSQRAMAVRVPLGVVAAITPFNFPINVPMHKFGPALAAGNAVVFKPSPKTPLTANRLGQAFIDAGWPPGWFNILHGGNDVVEALVSSDIQAINLTGGTAAGQAVTRHSFGKRVLLELGGNDPLILDEGADFEAALGIAVAQRFGSSGQRCTSCKRLFVHDSLYEEALERLIPQVEALVVGDPFDESTDVGPLISEEAARAVEARVRSFTSAGARVLTGGTRRGPYMQPTVVVDLDPHHPEALEETFGPLLPIYRFDELSEVIHAVNASPYGLQAGLFSDRLSRIRELFDQLEVGTLIVNHGPNFRVESLPFGGVKRSGLGREGVRFAVEELSELKTLVF